jgi:hypothetical protein
VFRTVHHVDERNELSRRLWLLREQLEQLVCALDIQQLVLANNRLRWLPLVTEDVEQLVEEVRASDAERTMLSAAVAAELGLPATATLAELADAVGEPHAAVWRRHRLSLLALRAEIENLSSTNRSVGLRGIAANREALAALGGDALDTYDPRGASAPLTTMSSNFDRTA